MLVCVCMQCSVMLVSGNCANNGIHSAIQVYMLITEPYLNYLFAGVVGHKISSQKADLSGTP